MRGKEREREGGWGGGRCERGIGRERRGGGVRKAYSCRRVAFPRDLQHHRSLHWSDTPMIMMVYIITIV